MPRRSFAVDLTTEDKAWLDQQLVNGGFQNYDDLVEQLKARGVQTSTSAVHRYGQRLEREIEAIKASTEAAKVIAETTPDEADARSAAVISLFQSGMFDAMLTVRESQDEMDPAARMMLFGKAARGLAALTQASLRQKKWAQDVRAKLNAAKKDAAEKAESVARKAGLSEDDWGQIRAHILGIDVEA